jgi:hypothetical protein
MQAAYKVGLYSISAQTIEHSILGFRSNRPAQVGTEKKDLIFLKLKKLLNNLMKICIFQ